VDVIVVKQAPVPIAFGTSIKYQTKFAFALQREADLVFSVRQRLIDVGKCKDVLGERVHVLLRRVASCKGDKKIEIANGLFALRFPADARPCGRRFPEVLLAFPAPS